MEKELQTLIRRAAAAIATIDAPATYPEDVFFKVADIVNRVQAVQRKAENLKRAIERASDEMSRIQPRDPA